MCCAIFVCFSFLLFFSFILKELFCAYSLIHSLGRGALSASLPPSISALLFLHPVIGRGGEQINKIQQDSGCKVQISPGRSARAGWGWVAVLGLLALSLMIPKAAIGWR